MTEYCVMTTPDPAELLQPHDAAALLGVTADTLRRYANEGVLPSQRVRPGGHRRFRRSDVEALIAAGSAPAEPAAERATA